MIRLFAPFLHDRQGVGLLLLRLLLAGGVLADAVARFTDPTILQILASLGEALAAILLAVGLWTPIAGSLVLLVQLGLVLASQGSFEIFLYRAGMGLCLVLLGPGVWSADARLFGPRRVVIMNNREN